MTRALKVTGKVLLIILGIVIALLLVIFVYHRIMLAKEESLIEEPIGQMVEVDGKKMCVYSSGSGEHTLVFLSGSGTASPILDFKSLYSQFEDQRIVVIEKFGYGYSDISGDDRSFDTILRQDREALSKVGITGPYVLCPHSMSGLEAILWAQNYPDEVEAIVGLDMCVPRSYDSYDVKATVRYEMLGAFARETGIIRFFYTDSMLPEGLSNQEKKIYKAIAAKKAVNADIMSESKAIEDAVKEIDSKPVPDVPMLMFCSDGKETGLDNWIGLQKDYAKGLKNAELIELDCGHYVHNHEPERISREIVAFLGGLSDKK